ncbi:MAG TPA: hypothetical protein VNZ48_22905 [Xanthobacteraceae bacterium]|jgi:hypothetical protein|nr:hypothetical protein [Xanthobacteraceae bacterium]
MTNTATNRELTESELESVSAAGFAGIDALIAVTQMKVDNANNNALDGADKQRRIVQQESSLHSHYGLLHAV